MLLNKYIMIFFLATSIALIINAIEGNNPHYSKPDVAQSNQIYQNGTNNFKDTNVMLRIINDDLPNLIIKN